MMIDPKDDVDAPIAGDTKEMFFELMRRLQVANAALDAEIAAEEAADKVRDEERAEKARSGELGADWRDVQARIDRGETTIKRVFSGDDDSAAARNLRAQSSRNLDALRDALVEQDDDDETPTPQETMNQMVAESRERHAAAAAHINDFIEDLRRRGAEI